MRISPRITTRLRETYAHRHEPESLRELARFFWTSVLSMFFIVTVCSLVFGVWEFLHLPQRTESVNVRSQTAFSKLELQKILQTYEARAVEFETRLAAPSPVKDPK